MQRNAVQEVFIELGTRIDNEGINKLFNLLESSKLKAMGLTTAFAGLTAAIYKVIEAATKREFELEKIAKQQSKNVALVRAENSALKAMGKTIEEINKDEHLKKIYDEVVAFNKELAFPNMHDALRKIEGLETSFYKLKSALGGAVQWLNAQIIANLEAPIDRITGKLENGATWLRDNMGKFTSKIALFISDFVKGIIGIAEGIGKIFEFINGLPDAIKAIGVAIAGVLVFFQGGVLGKIITVITLIGDLMHDYDNWKSNQEKGLKLGDEGYIPTAFGDFYEIIDSDMDTREKSRKVAEKFVTMITDLLRDVSDILVENHTLSDVLSGPGSIIGEIFGGITDYIDGNPDKIGEFISQIFTTLGSALEIAGGWGSSVAGFIAQIITTAFGSGEIWEDSNLKKALNGDNGIVNGIMNAIELDAIGASPLISILGGVFGGYKTERDKAIAKIFEEKTPYDAYKNGWSASEMEKYLLENGFGGEIDAEIFAGLQDDFNTFINGALEVLVGGFTIAGDIAGNLLKQILYAIFQGDSGVANTVTSALNEISEDNVIWDSVSLAIATWIGTGDFWIGLFAGVGDLLATMENKEQLEAAAQEFVNAFNDLWYGAVVDAETGERSGLGLESFIKNIWVGSDGEGGL